MQTDIYILGNAPCPFEPVLRHPLVAGTEDFSKSDAAFARPSQTQIHAAHVMAAKGYNFSHSIHHRYQTARLQTRISFHHLSFHSLSLNACVSFSLSRPFQCSILLSLSLQANLLHFILSFCHSVTPGKASSKDIFNLNTKLLSSERLDLLNDKTTCLPVVGRPTLTQSVSIFVEGFSG